MTKEQQLKQAETYIKKWQEILKLQAWEIKARIVNSSDIDGNEALVTFSSRSKLALVELAEEGTYEKGPWEDVCTPERAIVHELVHVLLTPMDDFWSTVQEEMSPSARNIAHKQFVNADEQVTEALARILVNLKGGD